MIISWHCFYPLQVIFCAGARTAFTGELVRVDEKGVGNLSQSLQVKLWHSQHASSILIEPAGRA